MILVLCDEADASGLWAADALRKRHLSPTTLTGIDLASVRGWRHTIGAAGSDVVLRFDGGTLRGRDVRGVLNRLVFLPRAWLDRIGGPDRDYAIQEMTAFYLSWLHALPGPKLNPPTPQGLCGNARHSSVWIALAARAGLPVRPFRQSSDDDPVAFWQMPLDPRASTVFVVGAQVIGSDALVSPHRPACLRLAEAAGCPLLGINFAPDAGGDWQVVSASVIPDLTQGGEALADALAAAFVQ
jgi:hypothetical protein